MTHDDDKVPTDPANAALPTYNAGPYQVRVGSLLVMQPDDTIFSELMTTVRLADEAAGEFVEVEQSGRTDLGKIAICRDEWLALATAINLMIAQCRSDK